MHPLRERYAVEILTFATGLLVGTLVVRADLDEVRGAELRLDGAPVCYLTADVPSCPVDLGPALTGHRLELIATTHGAGPPEVATRLLNLPGADTPEVRLHTHEEPDGSRGLFVGWAHPERLAPSSLLVTVDGVPILEKVQRETSICLPPRSGRHVVAARAVFPDAREATASLALGAARPSEAREELTAVPVEKAEGAEPQPGELSGRLGRRVRAVEPGGTALVIVLDPVAAALANGQRITAPYKSAAEGKIRSALAAFDVVSFVHPESRGARFGTVAPVEKEARLDTFMKGVEEGSAPYRLADAVAVSGLLAATGQRRRAVVLVAGDPRPDESRFAVADVLGYLRELMVPLHVLRLGGPIDAAWGPAKPIPSASDLGKALKAIRDSLESQRIAWVEGSVLPSALALEPRGDGLRLAGR